MHRGVYRFVLYRKAVSLSVQICRRMMSQRVFYISLNEVDREELQVRRQMRRRRQQSTLNSPTLANFWVSAMLPATQLDTAVTTVDFTHGKRTNDSSLSSASTESNSSPLCKKSSPWTTATRFCKCAV